MAFGRALLDAYRATSILYNPGLFYPTNVWCMSKVEASLSPSGEEYWTPLDTRRAEVILTQLKAYVQTLDVRSVASWVEAEYLGKYNVSRNFYIPESLRQQANVTKWFLGGTDVPDPVKTYLHAFWARYVPSDYRVKSPVEIPCPHWDASAGVCMVLNPTTAEPEWRYLKKGPYWDIIQAGTVYWLMQVEAAIPDSWLERSIESLIGVDNLELEALAVERPVIRTESGPGKVRWARSSTGNVYILGRMFIESVQDSDAWNASPAYIGKASNTVYGANRISRLDRDEWHLGSHGDDWIAYCPICQRWHSGDWSNWDLHISARQLLASYQAWYDQIRDRLTKQQCKWFYALAYYAIRCPSIWPWGRSGEESLSVRRTLGKVRSGSGDFIMHNNALNQSYLQYLLPLVHRKVGRKFPCRSKGWWSVFSATADEVCGWLAKPDAQLTHPHGFVACRCIHDNERAFMPRPCVSSVIRNWVNPQYDPMEYPNNTTEWMQVRLRDVNKTMAWSTERGQALMDDLIVVAMNSGVPDPWGVTLSEAELSRMIQKVVGRYSTRAYLES